MTSSSSPRGVWQTHAVNPEIRVRFHPNSAPNITGVMNDKFQKMEYASVIEYKSVRKKYCYTVFENDRQK